MNLEFLYCVAALCLAETSEGLTQPLKATCVAAAAATMAAAVVAMPGDVPSNQVDVDTSAAPVLH